jgi:hypothetical protein
MKVRTLRIFNDLQSRRLRKVGEMFEVSEKRAAELLAAHNGTLIEVIDNSTVKESGEEHVRNNKTGAKGKRK